MIAYRGEERAEGSAVRRLSLLLRGTSWQTWAFAGVAAGLIAGAGIRYRDVAEALIVAIYIVVLVSCAATDVASYRVPNAITYPAIVFALIAGALMPGGGVKETLGGAATAGGFMLVALIISRGAMGLGNVKLAVFSGLAVGWPLIGDALLLMALSGGAVATLLLLLRIKGRRDPIPYAPFISAATVAVILWQGTAFARF